VSKETYNIATNPKPSYDFQKDVISLCILRAITWGIADEKINNITTLSTDYELKYNVANNRSTQSPAATAVRHASWIQVKDWLICSIIICSTTMPLFPRTRRHYTFTSQEVGRCNFFCAYHHTVISLTAEEISVLHVVYADSTSPASHSKPSGVTFSEVVCKINW